MPVPPPSPSQPRIYVVEDHVVMRQMLCEVIEREPGWRIAGTAGAAEEALAAIDAADVDLVLVDVSLPGMSGIDLVREMKRQGRAHLCLMVSGHTEPSYAAQGLEAGACGYVLKGRPEELTTAMRTCLNGGTFLSRPLLDRLPASDSDEAVTRPPNAS